ncbi:MAG TPA: serine hydrolase [Candidatus Aquilonibacter sp.]|nr:serine hydrolase [Candidatus Aquilonibacter sp.]
MSIARFGVAVTLLCASIQFASAQSSSTEQRIHQIETCLPPAVIVKGESQCTPLLKRMGELNVHGVSIAVVHNGVIEWARGYGTASPSGEPVTPETIFQAGSISKPVAAMAALHLVQEDKLSLDENVNAKLTSWKIPPSDAAPGAVITLRELLTHTAGMTVHGFPGYAAGASVPTLVQVLNGEAPANTPAIRIETPPGTKWNYSGGGYTIMQQLMVDVSHEPFAKLMHDTVLAPIGMTHSTYQQPLPILMRTRAAVPYDVHGIPVPGGAHTYPEMAAAGLWTTPSDLGRYIIENQQSLQGKANHVLSQAMTKEMMTPGKGSWGLGVEIGGSPSNPYFEHGGVNEGFEALFVGYENNGEGAAVMTNAEGGSRLCAEIMSTIAVAYHWPDFQPALRTMIQLPPEALPKFVGSYHPVGAPPDFFITITLESDQLTGQIARGPKAPLLPESPSKFFTKQAPFEVEFMPNDKGEITSLVLTEGEHRLTATKTK